MINLTLLKKTMKANYKMLLIFIAVLTMYMTIIVGMYDPNNLDIVDMLAQMKLSEELLKAMGFTLTDTSLLGFIGSYFYGLLMLAFPMIFNIIMANRIIAGQVDKGSMAYLLSTPNTRKKIAFTQAKALGICVFLLIAYVTLLGIVYCKIKFPQLLDIKYFLLLNLGVLLLHFALSGISFFCSCVCSESKRSLAFGAGIPILFLLIQMLANSGEKLDKLRYITLFSLFVPADIIHGENYIFPFITLGVIGIVLYLSGIIIFDKKDLCI